MRKLRPERDQMFDAFDGRGHHRGENAIATSRRRATAVRSIDWVGAQKSGLCEVLCVMKASRARRNGVEVPNETAPIAWDIGPCAFSEVGANR
jgi:hypothetical protein